MISRVASSFGLINKAVGLLAGNPGVQQAAIGATTRASQLLSQSFATNSHDIFNVHKESADNNWNTEFDFSEANYKKVGFSGCS